MSGLKQRNYKLDGLLKACEEDKNHLQKLASDMRSQATALKSEIETCQRNFENDTKLLKVNNFNLRRL